MAKIANGIISETLKQELRGTAVTVVTFTDAVKHLPVAVLGGHNAAFTYLETNFDFAYLLPVLGKAHLQLKRNNVLPYLAHLYIVSDVDAAIEVEVALFNVSDLRVPLPDLAKVKDEFRRNAAREQAVEELAAMYKFVRTQEEQSDDFSDLEDFQRVLDTGRVEKILFAAGYDMDTLQREILEDIGSE